MPGTEYQPNHTQILIVFTATKSIYSELAFSPRNSTEPTIFSSDRTVRWNEDETEDFDFEEVDAPKSPMYLSHNLQ